jgi:adenine-specific DNA-methyltransferase
MKNRLEVAKDLLSDDGVIFVQCDDKENAYLRILLNEIFGRENFMNEIIWRYRTYQGQVKEFFPKKHDNIFWYKKVNRPEFSISYQSNYKDTVDFKRWSDFFIEDKIIYPDYPKTDSRFTAYLNKYIKENGEPKDGDIIYQIQGYIVDDVWEDIKAIDAKDKGQKTIFSGGQKPEELLERMIHSVTQKGDIVLDYHLGSGTTCAVAHKMGRQYIGIEQMDYIEDIAVKRMQKVIGKKVKKDGELLESVDFDTGGISKANNWQGGGEFIYFELAKYNQQYIDNLNAIKQGHGSTKTTNQLYDEIIDFAFLNYDVESDKLKAEKSDFEALSLANQLEFLFSILNKNQLYKNLTEMDDKDLVVDEKTKDLNNNFYNA